MTLQFQQRVITVRRPKDGDTYAFDVAVDRDLSRYLDSCRLLGFDCPESRRPATDFEIGKAQEAYNLVVQFLNAAGDLWVRRELKLDSLRRELVTVWHVVDDVSSDLGETLFDAGLATRWPTRWRQVYC